MDAASLKHSPGRNLMIRVFGTRKPSKRPEYPETVGTLAF